MPFTEMLGRTFGRLTVIASAGKNRKGKPMLRARCSCGNEKVFLQWRLVHGRTKSCGCLRRETTSAMSRKHGESAFCLNTTEYQIWKAMKQRCSNPKHVAFENYGGRGIEVCQEWRDSFDAFLADMGRRPSLRHSIDRIDNSGNYEPNNCRWATWEEQANNRRKRRTRRTQIVEATVAIYG